MSACPMVSCLPAGRRGCGRSRPPGTAPWRPCAPNAPGGGRIARGRPAGSGAHAEEGDARARTPRAHVRLRPVGESCKPFRGLQLSDRIAALPPESHPVTHASGHVNTAARGRFSRRPRGSPR
jgi:hypothetical protein